MSNAASRTRVETSGFLRRNVFSTDHKAIGKLYLYLSMFAVVVGMILSWLMRIHLVWPLSRIPGLQLLSSIGAPNGVMKPEYYLSLLTIHGTLMVFFVLTAAPLSAFGHYFLPLQLGSRQMAFPTLSAASFWATFVALMTLLASFFVGDGPPISGWTAYPPLSAVGADAGPGQGLGQTLWLVSIFVFSIGAIMSSINFIATVLDLRTTGMSLMRMPLTCWSWFVASTISLLTFPILAVAGVALLMDRLLGTSFFVPAGLVVTDRLQPHSGGSPLLWQHLFWFFGHPEVYIAIVPPLGIISHVLSCSCRKSITSYRAVVYCMLAIGILSFAVWGHHMFVSGMTPYSAFAFSVPTLLITIPSAIVVLLWITTLWGARLRFTTAGMFAIGFISLFVSGGLGGFFLGQPSLSIYLHATYFVVGHFHLVMAIAAIFAVFAGLYFWFPKIYGRMMSEQLGKVHFWMSFIGAYSTFMPMHYLGLAGVVRRYSAFMGSYMDQYLPLQKFITYSALTLGAGQLIFLANFLWSIWRGKQVPENPWQATTLEWSTASPPPIGNFNSEPVVQRGAYEYEVQGERDFVMQCQN